MRLAVLALVPALTACGGSAAVDLRSEPGTEPAPVADRLCAEAADRWDAELAAAYDATVEDVRDYLRDPHGADRESSSAPVPGPGAVPADWAALDPDRPAAVCYLDAPVPKGPPPAADASLPPPFDRRLVLAADGADSFVAKAGHQASMRTEPLPGPY